MDHRITQCPRCGTSFRVTEAHLAVAAGAVRCGSCLHIFNARDHWAEEKPAPEPEPESIPEENLDELIIDDDALFDDNTPLFADSKDTARDAAERLPDNVIAGNFSRREPPPQNDSTANSLLANEFSAHESPLFNATDGDFAPIEEDAPEQLSDSFTELDNWEKEIGNRFGRVQDLDEELAARDEEWTRDLLRDDEPLFAAQPQTATATSADYGLVDAEPADARREPTFGSDDEPLFGDDTGLFDDAPEDEAPGVDAHHEDDELLSVDDDSHALEESAAQCLEPEESFNAMDTFDDDELLATEPPRAAAPYDQPAAPAESELAAEFLNAPSAHRAIPAPVAALARAAAHAESETVITDASYGPEPAETEASPLASLDRLAAEPLQIHRFRHEPRWPGVLWGLGLLLMLGLLAWQYVHANFDALARGPARPWLVRACELAGCGIPAREDVAQIHSGNLIVRSHPTRAGALAVDAIITNQAPFPQPYPQLQLQFTDLNGAPVASRRFQPAEYLAGELSGASLMPVQQPVHIALELVDPGPQAVNYALTVVPASAPAAP